MDDWYGAFVPAASTADDKSKHKRRASLLQQPNDSDKTDAVAVVEPPVVELDEEVSLLDGPPEATLARRAQSYTDFHHALLANTNKTKAKKLHHGRKTSLDFASAHGSSLRSDLEFADWYMHLEDELLEESHRDYACYQEELQLSHDHLDSLLASTSSTLSLLSSLSDSFKAVEAQTTAFQAQCESLVTEQRRVTALADDVADNLRYYAYLEPMTRRLNAPGATNLVRDKDFPEMLANLDNCLEYMQEHPAHSEAATYRSRYRLLLTRALTLIRVHFTNSLRSLAADVSQRIADKQLNDTTQAALLYAKFRVGAPELKQLGYEIQKRAVLAPGADAGGEAEYQSLVNELHQSYSTTRGRLLFPIITRRMHEIAALDDAAGDLVTFARSAIGFVRGICLDEHDLWNDWFSGSDGLYEFLDALFEPLYDHLRPKTIHETRILRLCELCTFIQTRFMEEEDEDDIDSPSEGRPPKKGLDFAPLIQPALEDAQTRLVFLAQAVLRDDIENYKPTPQDLDYPATARRASTVTTTGKRVPLSGRKGSADAQSAIPKTPMIVDEDDGGASVFESQFGNVEKQSTTSYPTLRKAAWLLSRIYRLVNSTVFDDLAHRIVHSTTQSLVTASLHISRQSSPTDARLFLISHLLRLKQQIVAFDIEYVTSSPEISFDFSALTNKFYEIKGKGIIGGLWNPTAWVKIAVSSGGGLLVPKVVENMLDAKVELDGRLRSVINDFVTAYSSRITAPLSHFHQEHLSSSRTNEDAEDQDLNTAANKATVAARGIAQKEIVTLRRRLDEYIEDARTRETLVAAVRDQVILSYEEWIERNVSANNEKIKIAKMNKKGKGREDEVWAADVFAEWCDATFAVGNVVASGGAEE
ncbi:hypothetical protein AAFC00_006743 [Neodothiora populina]|uniref:Conserved oligomeric Golgi complex subunit 3 n=1 Tax=Neodothiora populina TaxID=2781224 RepID=A0ABR3PB13_9PEZI